MLKAHTKTFIIATSLLALSSTTSAKEISYDYVQGTYSSITDSSLSTDVDGNGLSISGSFSVAPNIAITALYGAVDYDRVLGIDISSTELDLGITAHASIAPNTDVFGNFSVIKGEVEASDGFITVTDDDTGNVISVGVRHLATEAIEISGGFSRVDIFDDTANTFGIGARFYAGKKFSIGVGYSTGDDVDAILLNARLDIK